MKILFLSVYGIQDSNDGYIYADLVREFARKGHSVYAVTPTRGQTESYSDENGVTVIRVKNGQVQKTSRIKKVINLLTLEKHTISAVKKCAKGVKFDLIVNMCSNLCYAKTVAYFKKRDRAVNYLLLKDMLPQNAVDIGIMATSGPMGFVYRHFKKKEKKFYRNADYIGCMSEANREYVVRNHSELAPERVTVVPNSIEPQDVSLDGAGRAAMREKYGLPQDKTIFIYGGNLGKPQDIPFIIECLRAQKENNEAFLFIVGDGTEYGKLEQFMETDKPSNVKLMKRLPREDFDVMLAACDIGLIFLDHRFTVPNYPSRLLSYMQAGLPVLACTDPNTDVGKDIVAGGFGWQCESNDAEAFGKAVREATHDNSGKREAALRYLKENFTVERCFRLIMKSAFNCEGEEYADQ